LSSCDTYSSIKYLGGDFGMIIIQNLKRIRI
jgi:hypothetical protein